MRGVTWMRSLARSRPWIACLLAGALAAGCAARTGDGASGAVPAPSDRGRDAGAGPAPLPSLPVAQVADGGAAAPRMVLAADGEDLRTVIGRVARHFGLDFQVDPQVTGTVTASLRGATLEQTLDAVLAPLGYAYQVQGGVLRVTPTPLQTRFFSLDYLALSRLSFAMTTVQRTLGAGGAGGAGGGMGGGLGGGAGGMGGGGGGMSMITTTESADLWRELQVALQALVFDDVVTTSGGTGGAGGGAAGIGALGGGMGGMSGGMGAMGGGGPAPFSRVAEDGRRLIINPIAGTIVVSAPPLMLEGVETFISTFERSIQRQVLIEAKIVEVTLNRRHRFGIDWNAVQRLAGLGFEVRSNEGGVSLALRSPGNRDASQETSLILQALDQQGDVRVLSSPHLSVMNNQRASINVSTDEVFFSVTRQPILGPTGGTIGFETIVQPQQIAVGITLDVMAQVAPDNTITMNVRPTVTNVVRVESIRLEEGTQLSAPIIDRRETDTMVRARAGETILIGGLMQTVRSDERSGIPVLRDIPLIGRFFQSRSERNDRRELVIFLTPTVVAGQPPTRSQ